MRTRARAVYIVEYGQKSSGPANRLKSQTKQIPLFPVEISYKEPDLTLLVEYEASLANRHAVGPKGGKLRKRRKSTKNTSQSPRAKGTNPRAKAKP